MANRGKPSKRAQYDETVVLVKSGTSVKEAIVKTGISIGTFYRYQKKDTLPNVEVAPQA